MGSELDYWVILTAENEDGVLVIRLRTTRPDIADPAAFRTSVIISWRYSAGSAGMPTDEEKREIDAFEREIDGLTMANDNSHLMAVATGLGLREYIFYTRNYNAFMRSFNALLATRAQRLPLTIEYYDDPTWKNWLDFLRLYERSQLGT
jgi:hypothetical protein